MDVQNLNQAPAQPPVSASQNPPPRETQEPPPPPAQEAERSDVGQEVDYRA